MGALLPKFNSITFAALLQRDTDEIEYNSSRASLLTASPDVQSIISGQDSVSLCQGLTRHRLGAFFGLHGSGGGKNTRNGCFPAYIGIPFTLGILLW